MCGDKDEVGLLLILSNSYIFATFGVIGVGPMSQIDMWTSHPSSSVINVAEG